jgi:hypothetical protein
MLSILIDDSSPLTNKYWKKLVNKFAISCGLRAATSLKNMDEG